MIDFGRVETISRSPFDSWQFYALDDKFIFYSHGKRGFLYDDISLLGNKIMDNANESWDHVLDYSMEKILDTANTFNIK